jgi:P-type Cu+ transporter
MSDAREAIEQLRAQRAQGRPTLPCNGCGAAVDPLRAARVAIFHGRFHYFCSPGCREQFTPSPAAAPPVAASAQGLAPALPFEQQSLPEAAPVAAAAPQPAVAPAALEPLELPAPATALHYPELLASAALGIAALACDAGESGSRPAGLAPGLALAAFVALCWGTWRRRDLVWRRPSLLGLVPPLLATLAALGSLLVDGRAAPHAASVAGAICCSAAISLALVSRRRQLLAPFADRLQRALLGKGRRPPEAAAAGASGELRPGEEFLLEPGDRVPADAVISSGRARVEPWFGSLLRVPRQEGDTLLAGARVVEGDLRAVVRWAGADRAWARLTLDPERRADRHASPARLAERLSTSGAFALGALGALLAFSAQPHAALVLSSAAALAATLANVALPELVALQLSNGLHELLARGISFRGPEALDRAAHSPALVFCAEGTLLSDAPSVASIEPQPSLGQPELLALISGAFAAVAAPLASALQRCAQAHQVRPDSTRSPTYAPGLGVTAVASTGQSLVVGTRALLLGRRISVAAAETRLAELESLGRSVLLCALDGRYVGLLAFQDGVAPGARGAVQTLIDADVEPILLSGEARDTCRALGQHLGIEHVRPEILPEERANELRRLAESTPGLAVVGRSSKDDAALAVAPLSINIDEAGGPLERWDVDVASGDVRDAAWAVYRARKLYSDTLRSVLITSAPVLVALLLLLAGFPAWLAPFAGLTGSAVASSRMKRRRGHTQSFDSGARAAGSRDSSSVAGSGGVEPKAGARPLRPSRVSAEDSI